MTRRRFLLLAPALAAVGCQGKELCVLGYTSAPPFDPSIRTIYIPIFKNMAYHTSPYRGIETDMTEAIVRELNARRSPMRVVSDPTGADTELVGTVTNIGKGIYNRTNTNFNREFEVVITVGVVWRDLRSGKVIVGRTPPAKAEAFDPDVPPPPADKPDPAASPISLTAGGRVLPEVGETNATGAKAAIEKLAKQIVNMMEARWEAPPPSPRR